MAKKKKKSKASAKPAKTRAVVKRAKAKPARGKKAATKTKRAKTKSTPRKAKPAVKAKAARKAPAKKAKKKAVRKEVFGEGNYTASRNFRKEETSFVTRNKRKIPQMGKAAEAALEGPEGKDLLAAEAEARGHAAGMADN
jgi:hypothetical protein